MEWIKVSYTQLAEEVGAIRAGKLFKKAGFAKRKGTVSGEAGTYGLVDSRAADLTKADMYIILAQQEGSETMEDFSTPQIEPKPSYAELTETIEHLNRLIEELRQENCQLRQHLATANSNGMGDRARKALTAARRTLEFFKE